MNKRLLFATVAWGCLTASGSVWAQDPPATKMLAESYFDARRAAEQQEAEPFTTIDREVFTSSYHNAGSPKVVFLFGEQFSGLVSDWYSQRRLNIQADAQGNAHTQVPDHLRVTAKSEHRVHDAGYRDTLLSPAQWSDYEEGFRSVLFEYGVQMINRQVAIRLLDAELREQNGRNPEDDGQRLEMDMLRKHSQAIVEITPYRDDRRKFEPIGFRVAITSLENAVVLADDRIGIPKATEVFRAGANGYQKGAPRPDGTIEVGATGYEFVADEENLWAERGRMAGLKTLELLHSRWLSL